MIVPFSRNSLGPLQSGSGKSILHSIHMHMVYNDYSICFTDQIPNSLQLSCKALLLETEHHNVHYITATTAVLYIVHTHWRST